MILADVRGTGELALAHDDPPGGVQRVTPACTLTCPPDAWAFE